MSISAIAAAGMGRAALSLVNRILNIPAQLKAMHTASSAATKKTNEDVSLSKSIRKMQAEAGILPSARPENLDAAKKISQANITAFATEMGKTFRANGIDTSVEIVLKTDAAGKVVVAGAHPQARQIEALIEREGYGERFKQLSLAGGMVRNLENAANGEQTSPYMKSSGMAIPRLNIAFSNNTVLPFFTAS